MKTIIITFFILAIFICSAYSQDTPYFNLKDKTGQVVFQIDTLGQIDTSSIAYSFSFVDAIYVSAGIDNPYTDNHSFNVDSGDVVVRGDILKAIRNLLKKYYESVDENERLRRELIRVCDIATAALDCIEIAIKDSRVDILKRQVKFSYVSPYSSYAELWTFGCPSIRDFYSLINK